MNERRLSGEEGLLEGLVGLDESSGVAGLLDLAGLDGSLAVDGGALGSDGVGVEAGEDGCKGERELVYDKRRGKEGRKRRTRVAEGVLLLGNTLLGGSLVGGTENSLDLLGLDCTRNKKSIRGKRK
jgi:hypothetical protein